jgi:hypothetical protein
MAKLVLYIILLIIVINAMNGNSDKCPCTESNKEYGEINIIDGNYNRLLT